MREGVGMMNFGVSGDEYRGEFQKDVRNGFGVFSSPGSYGYVGYFEENKYEGRGKFMGRKGGEIS